MWRGDRTFFLRSEPGTGASLQKMWRGNRTFFLRSEPGTVASLQKMWRGDRDRTFFLRFTELTENVERARDCWLQLIDGNEGLAGLFFCACEGQGEKKPKNFGQVPGRADRNCGGSTALFSFFFWRGSEPGTGAGRVDRNCGEREMGLLTSVNWWEWGSRWPFFALFHIFFTLLPSFSLFSLFFFALFHIFFTFFTLFLFFTFFPFLFSHSFSHFRWPGRGRSLAALPCLPLPYLTLPLLSSPSLTLFEKRSIEIFSRFLC